MRGEVIAELMERAKNDPEFRSAAIEDLDGTLSANGYDLDEDEMKLVRDFHQQVVGLSDAQILEALDPEVAGHAA